MNDVPELVIGELDISLGSVKDMLLECIIQILPKLQGLVLNRTHPTALLPLNFEAVQSEESRGLLVLYLLEEVIKPRLRG